MQREVNWALLEGIGVAIGGLCEGRIVVEGRDGGAGSSGTLDGGGSAPARAGKGVGVFTGSSTKWPRLPRSRSQVPWPRAVSLSSNAASDRTVWPLLHPKHVHDPRSLDSYVKVNLRQRRSLAIGGNGERMWHLLPRPQEAKSMI